MELNAPGIESIKLGSLPINPLPDFRLAIWSRMEDRLPVSPEA
jgi:hypothetical protein